MYQAQELARGLATAVLVALAGLTIATPAMAGQPNGSTTLAPTPPRPSTVAWGQCPEDVADPYAQLECAAIPVPLDYDNPDGEKIELMVSRLASTNPGDRQGVLMLNPGGPGGSGLAQPVEVARLGIPASVLNNYDVLGMDTRGVGHSAPVSCAFTIEQNYQGAVPVYAADDAAVASRAEISRGVANQCAANNTTGHLQHVSTANMARDLDQIRTALGEETMSYFGLSYGSALGAAYASLFPETSGRVILDSNIGDTHVDRDTFRRYGLGTEETFPDFAKWAAERDGTYELGSTSEEVRETYFEIAAQLDEKPKLGLDGHLFRLSTFGALYNEISYPETAQIWQALLTAEEPSPEGNAPANPVEDVLGATGPHPSDNSFSVFLAVTCNDAEFTDDVSAYQRAVAEDREKFPVFGAATANIMPCAFWPYEPSEPPVAINDEGPQNILILQNERDPVTPLLGGELIREKFDERSRLVTANASGHGVYVYGDNPCADAIATEFLLTGALPEKDTQC
jgi:pimeloyl-ACP methyl ester carboxylesterase